MVCIYTGMGLHCRNYCPGTNQLVASLVAAINYAPLSVQHRSSQGTIAVTESGGNEDRIQCSQSGLVNHWSHCVYV